MIYKCVLALAILGVCAFAQGGHHHEYRKYTCVKKPNGQGTDCTLTLKKHRDDEREFKANINQGCFQEESGIYCPLYCPETGAAYVIAKTPSNNHKCVNLDSYKGVDRNGEWFFWRRGDCIEQEMTFELGCHFLIPSDQANVEQFFRKV